MLNTKTRNTQRFEIQKQVLFENDMFNHSNIFASKFCEFIGEHQIRIALRQMIKRANNYGFKDQESIKLFIEMMYIFGSDFDTDPQYPALNKILRKTDSNNDQTNITRMLTNITLEYIVNIIGEDDLKFNNSLVQVKRLLNSPLQCTLINFKTEIIQKLTQIYPQKVNNISNERLGQLINISYIESHRYKISTVEGVTLLLINMLYFGHGCLNDPLYPLLSQTLNDKNIVNQKARIRRLKKNTIKWMNFITV